MNPPSTAEIILKSAGELAIMRRAGRVAQAALQAAAAAVHPGATTFEIDQAAHEVILSRGAKPTFLGYEVPGRPTYRHATCISVNQEVVHGIPRADHVIQSGDVVSIDVGATLDGYVGDCALTCGAGVLGRRGALLISATREALYAAIALMRPGATLYQLSCAIQGTAESYGFGVVRQYVGHGVGRKMHEPPQVPHFADPRVPEHDLVLVQGMVIAVEPMLTEGTWKTRELEDGWTVVTCDRRLASHWEHTIAITENGHEILTREGDE